MHKIFQIFGPQDLREKHPEMSNDFEQGLFMGKTNKIPFTAKGVDYAQEHINKIHKGDGGLTGITTNFRTGLRSSTCT